MPIIVPICPNPDCRASFESYRDIGTKTVSNFTVVSCARCRVAIGVVPREQ